MAVLGVWARNGLIAIMCILAVSISAVPVRAQDTGDGFANGLAGIVGAMDVFFSMPLQEWNREIVRLPNVRRDDIFGSIDRGLGVRFDAGGFIGSIEPDFETAASLSCLRIVFETSRVFSDARLAAIEEDKIKPAMKVLSERYDSKYALKSSESGLVFTLFITRRAGADCLIYNQVKLDSPAVPGKPKIRSIG